MILVGDFNIDILALKENIVSEYFDMLTSNSFYTNITVPTWLIKAVLACIVYRILKIVIFMLYYPGMLVT